MKLFDLDDLKVTVAAICGLSMQSFDVVVAQVTTVGFMLYVLFKIPYAALKLWRLWKSKKGDD